MVEHQCNKESDINEIKNDVKAILKVLNGNGVIGLCAKVQTLWEYHNDKKRSYAGLTDWAFRAFLFSSFGSGTCGAVEQVAGGKRRRKST